MLRQILLILWAWAAVASAAPSEFVRITEVERTAVQTELDWANYTPPALDYRKISFDIRDIRGGRGDVAAAYLMALDLLKRFHFQGQIDLLVHEALALARVDEAFFDGRKIRRAPKQ